jgi:hypothetical protein
VIDGAARGGGVEVFGKAVFEGVAGEAGSVGAREQGVSGACGAFGQVGREDG